MLGCYSSSLLCLVHELTIEFLLADYEIFSSLHLAIYLRLCSMFYSF